LKNSAYALVTLGPFESKAFAHAVGGPFESKVLYSCKESPEASASLKHTTVYNPDNDLI